MEFLESPAMPAMAIVNTDVVETDVITEKVDDSENTETENIESGTEINVADFVSLTESAFEDVHKNLASISQLEGYKNAEDGNGSDSSDENDITELPMNHKEQSSGDQTVTDANEVEADRFDDQTDSPPKEQLSMDLEGTENAEENGSNDHAVSDDLRSSVQAESHIVPENDPGLDAAESEIPVELENGHGSGSVMTEGESKPADSENVDGSVVTENVEGSVVTENVEGSVVTENVEGSVVTEKEPEVSADMNISSNNVNVDEGDTSGTDDIAPESLENFTETVQENLDDSMISTDISPTHLALHQSPSRRGRGRKRRWSSGRGWSSAKRKKIYSPLAQVEDMSEASGGDINLDQSDMDVDQTVITADAACSTPEAHDKTLDRARRQSKTPQYKQGYYYMGEKVEEEVKKSSRHLLIDHGRKAAGSILGKKTLSDEEIALYKEPFISGWKREIVLRGVCEDDILVKKKNPPCDVYYFPPTGPKLRSMVQIQDWISRNHETNLTARNFSFMRQTIGVEEGEVVRHASASRGRGSPRGHFDGGRRKLNDSFAKPHVVIERDSDDYVSPMVATAINSEDSSGRPSLKMKFSPKTSPSKRGRPRKIVAPERTLEEKSLNESVQGDLLPVAKVKEEKVELSQPSKNEIIVFPSLQQQKKLKSTARKSTTQKMFKQSVPSTSSMKNLCSVACPGMGGVAPMLYCNVCMCLFHNECVNYFGPDSEFICLRCESHANSSGTSLSGSDLLKGSPMSMMTVSMPVQLLGLPSKPIQMMSGSPVQASSSGSARTPTPHMFIKSVLTSDTETNSQPITVLKTFTTSSPGNSESPINKSPYAEIRPAGIKQEPVDDAYDVANGKSKHASSEALGNLKTVINSRMTSSLLVNQLSKPSPDYRKTNSIPMTSISATRSYSQTLLSNAINSLNRLNAPVNHGINTLSSVPNSSGLRFVSLGPGIPIQNMPIPMQRLQAPGLLGAQIPGNQSNAASSSLFNWPSTQNKNQVRPSLGTTQPMPNLTVAPAAPLLTTTVPPLTSPVNGSSVVGPVVVNAKHVGAPMNGQLLTLPAAVVKRLSLTKPLALKINNKQINVPPSGFFQTSEGLKVFLPPDTFPAAEDLDESNYSVEKTFDNKSLSTEKPGKEAPPLAPIPVIESVKGAVPVDVSESKFKDYFTRCPIQKLTSGFECMLHIFQYLNVKDLIRVGIVCKSWRRVSKQPCLWEHISFTGMKVANWSKILGLLKKHSIHSLSLIGMEQWDDMAKTWHGLTEALQELPDLRHVTFGQVPAAILDLVCRQLPSLHTVNAMYITNLTDENKWSVPTPLDIGQFKTLTNLRELRLKGLGGLVLPAFSLAGGLEQLGSLTNLEVLSILSFKDVKVDSFQFISRLPKLQELAIGDCTGWTPVVYQELGRCDGLRRLHLENGGGDPDPGLGEALTQLLHLERLELLCFKIPSTFRSHLCQLEKLIDIVIQPDNTSLGAEINTNTLAAVKDLAQLVSLKWVVSGQDCNAIILDDADAVDSSHSGKSTPTVQQKWIPFLMDEQTEYTGLNQLKEKLSQLLPDTRVSIVSLKPQEVS